KPANTADQRNFLLRAPARVENPCYRGRVSRTSSLLPHQHHLPRLPGPHHVKTLLEIRIWESMRNHSADVQARLEHHRHFVPRLVHLAAVDALDVEHVEDDRV